MNVNFQIGQCRVWVEVGRTEKAYETYPTISENCDCGDCTYFEEEIIKKDIRLFRILKKMGVDLSRQPNTGNDGICSVGPTEKYKRAYIGRYNVFGKLGKTQRTPNFKNSEGTVESVDFYIPDEEAYTQYKIKQETPDELEFSFYLECEKITPYN